MKYSGGYSAGVPPLPIPNREVKPGRADGTAPQCGRVGRRRPQWQGPFLKGSDPAFLLWGVVAIVSIVSIVSIVTIVAIVFFFCAGAFK